MELGGQAMKADGMWWSVNSAEFFLVKLARTHVPYWISQYGISQSSASGAAFFAAILFGLSPLKAKTK